VRPGVGQEVAVQELEAIGLDMLAKNERRSGRFLSNLGWAALELGDNARAERLLRTAESHLADASQTSDEPSGLSDLSDHAAVIERMAVLCERTGRSDEAARWRSKLAPPSKDAGLR
jgi:hypothetical protein